MGQRARAADSAPVPRGWEGVQESLGRIAGVSLLTFDARGQELAATGVPELCRLIEADPRGASRCADSCGAQREQALAQNRKLFYRCHAGLQCFALPVRVGGRAIAAVTGGRTLERAAGVDAIGALAGSLALPDDAVRRAIGALSLGTARLLVRAAELSGRAAETLFAADRELAAERSRVALLTSLLAIGADFAREQAPHEVHALILDAASILFDVERACLLVRDERTGSFRLRTAFGSPSGLLPAAGLPADSPLLDAVLRERAPAVILDRQRIADGGFPPGTGSLAAFPLIAGERILGVLCVFDTPLGEEETALLSAFCQSAALALSNALLREELSRRSRQIERSERIRERLAPLLAWDEVVAAVFEEAVLLAGAREASLMLFDRSQRTLRVRRAHGTHTAVLKAVTVAAGEGIAGRVAREGRPLLVEDFSREAGLERPRRLKYRTDSFLVVPLVMRGRVLGVINLADKETGAPFGPDDLEAVLAVTAQASRALQTSALHARMSTLREQAVTDPLTGLANRRYLERRLREEASRARRHGASFTLTMIDLDNFKTYNDREGHPAGDALLAAVSRVVRSTARETDLVARYGGDEFALVSPGARAEETLLFAERLRSAIERHPFELPGAPVCGGLTLSAGVAEFPADAADPVALVRAADTALYRAKAAGRNRIARTGP